MRPRIARVALAACLLGPSAASAQAQGTTPFDRYDVNKDGKVIRTEVPERLRERFDSIDLDKDGTITAEEQRAYLLDGPGSPPRAKVEQDIPYAGTKDPRQTLDLLLPAKPRTPGPLPVVVSLHGGAWLGGNKAQGIASIRPLVLSGDYAAVAINYRLTGQASWPAQAHDVKAALRWVRDNATKYHLDPDRIGVIGQSAGGHLAALLGTSGGVADLEGDPGPGVKVRCVVDEYGPADLLAMGDPPGFSNHNDADSPESKLVGGPIQERKDVARAASPITYVSKDDPPFLIIHGDKDRTVAFDQSDRLAKALRGAGVEALLVQVKGGGHGGFRNPEVASRIRQFFDKHLRDQPVGTISEEPIPNVAPAGPKKE